MNESRCAERIIAVKVGADVGVPGSLGFLGLLRGKFSRFHGVGGSGLRILETKLPPAAARSRPAARLLDQGAPQTQGNPSAKGFKR